MTFRKIKKTDANIASVPFGVSKMLFASNGILFVNFDIEFGALFVIRVVLLVQFIQVESGFGFHAASFGCAGAFFVA